RSDVRQVGSWRRARLLCSCGSVARPDSDRPAVYDARDHPAPAYEFAFKPHTDLIHAKARFADLRDFQHRAVTQPYPGAGRKAHHVQAFNSEVLLDGAGFDANLVERFLRSEER